MYWAAFTKNMGLAGYISHTWWNHLKKMELLYLSGGPPKNKQLFTTQVTFIANFFQARPTLLHISKRPTVSMCALNSRDCISMMSTILTIWNEGHFCCADSRVTQPSFAQKNRHTHKMTDEEGPQEGQVGSGFAACAMRRGYR